MAIQCRVTGTSLNLAYCVSVCVCNDSEANEYVSSIAAQAATRMAAEDWEQRQLEKWSRYTRARPNNAAVAVTVREETGEQERRENEISQP